MAIKATRRPTEKAEMAVMYRGTGGPSKSNICVYWLAGRCNKKPCRFIHSETPCQPSNYNSGKQYRVSSYGCPKSAKSPLVPSTEHGEAVCHTTQKPVLNATLEPGRNSNQKSSHTTNKPALNSTLETGRNSNQKSSNRTSHKSNIKPSQKPGVLMTRNSAERVCSYWIRGNCVKGDHCQYLHSWFLGHEFSILAELQGHKKAITGIALPSGSDKLYSGSTDGTARIWDCCSGQCIRVINLGAEVGSLISEGPWVFLGLPNVIKAWNIQTSMEFFLEGPAGKVYAMVVANEMLLAAVQDGAILAWKGCSESNPFKLAASLKGHTCAVLSLAVGGGKRLYSGSIDRTIRVWDLDTLQCVMTLDAHSDSITSLICWDDYLLSCSLDCTIKVWFATESGNLEVAYIHNEPEGLIALCGMTDAAAKPILYCSCNDNSVRLYELPSFTKRERLFARQEVRSLQIGPGGLFFSGDRTGLLTVWKWLAEPNVP